MNLILLDPSEVGATGLARLGDVRARHIRGVLRAVPGQDVRIGLIDGPLGTATVQDITGDSVALTCRFEPAAPPPPSIDLLLALPRPKVLRRLWAQMAALGVGRVILTNAEKVERDYFDTHYLSPETYRPLLIEGLQQAKDTRVPLVTVHKRFRVLVEDELDALCPNAHRLVCEPASAQAIEIGTQLPTTVAIDSRSQLPASTAVAIDSRSQLPASTAVAIDSRSQLPMSTAVAIVSRSQLPEWAAGGRVLVAVGPEGGWNAFELALLEQRGFQRFSMGARVLRADTACIAALSLVHHALGV